MRYDDPPLPPGGDVDVTALLRLFDDTSSSYKYLFFLALLDLVAEDDARRAGTGDAAPLVLALDEVGARALALAFQPRLRYRLSFGLQDRVARILDGLPPEIRAAPEAGRPDELAGRLKLVIPRRELGGFLKQVPQRLLSPFLRPELVGVRDSMADSEIRRIAARVFATGRTLYRFDEARANIELHPSWRRYFVRHGPIVRAWAAWHFLRYMEGRNPTAFGVREKLFPAADRAALAEQSKYWKTVLERRGSLRCLYSGAPLGPFALDHFLPWSFQPNDRIWNLVPVSPPANSAKGDRLPHLDYLEPLARVQAVGLVEARGSLKAAKVARITEPFLADLEIDPDLLSGGGLRRIEKALLDCYARKLAPLTEVARSQGFETGWRWRAA